LQVLMETADVMFSTSAGGHQRQLAALTGADGSGASTVRLEGVTAAGQLQQSRRAAAGEGGGGHEVRGALTGAKPPGGTVHTLLTSNGSPYQNFQGRIMCEEGHDVLWTRLG
jgi:hypothetical protein